MKSSIIHIDEIISKIVKYSFQTGIFPDDLKAARICSIFQDGEKHLLTNYRPISILLGFSKIFEKALYNRLLSFLESRKVLVNQQYGFREIYSTYMAVMIMYEGISAVVHNRLRY